MELTFMRSAGFNEEGPYDGENINLTFKVNGDETWSEYVEYFERFLMACGYVPRKDGKFVEEILYES